MFSMIGFKWSSFSDLYTVEGFYLKENRNDYSTKQFGSSLISAGHIGL